MPNLFSDFFPKHILSEEDLERVDFLNFYNMTKYIKTNLNQDNLYSGINAIISLIEKIYIENPDIISFDMSVKRCADFHLHKKYNTSLKWGLPVNKQNADMGQYQSLLNLEIENVFKEGYQGYCDYFDAMFFVNDFCRLTQRNDRFKIYEQICDKSNIAGLQQLITNWKNNNYESMTFSHFGSYTFPLFFSDFSEKNRFRQDISDIKESEYHVINLIWESLAFKTFSFATQHNSEEVLLQKIKNKDSDTKTIFSLSDKNELNHQIFFNIPLPENNFNFSERVFKTKNKGSCHIFLDSFIDFTNTKRMISNSDNLTEHLQEGIRLMISQYEQKHLSELLDTERYSLKNISRI